MQAKKGDFVTASQKDLPGNEGTRQGILIEDNKILLESGGQIFIGTKRAIVPDKHLWGNTRGFVFQWRKANL